MIDHVKLNTMKLGCEVCILSSLLECVERGLLTLDVNLGAYITKTCSCNIQRLFSASKIENFIRKILIFFLFLLKT